MLCACRNETTWWLKLIVLALAGVLALAAMSAGGGPAQERAGDDRDLTTIESNNILVRRDLTRGAILLALGTEMDVMEHRGLIESLKTPGCAGLDDPVSGELLALRGALKGELARHMPTEAERLLKVLTSEKLHEVLTRAAKAEGVASFDLDEFRVEVGFATYHYWQVRVRPYEEKGLLREKGERLAVLPCTKQTYVRFTLRPPPRVRL
ncbi:MAG: hypothetical protein U0797_19175 [Gemmataceae bacterium]